MEFPSREEDFQGFMAFNIPGVQHSKTEPLAEPATFQKRVQERRTAFFVISAKISDILMGQ